MAELRDAVVYVGEEVGREEEELEVIRKLTLETA